MILEPELTCPDGVVFDPVEHRYLLDGKHVPSVSTILKVINPDQYDGIAEDILQRAAQRGNNGHAMIALDVRDQLDYTSLDGLLADHWEAWDRFRNDYQFECTYSERIVCSRTYGYCGAVDLAGSLLIKRKRVDHLVDIKFTAAEPSMADVQTAGYDIAAAESLPGWKRGTPRGCLWITGNQYRFITYPKPSDYAVFIAGRTILTRRESK